MSDTTNKTNFVLHDVFEFPKNHVKDDDADFEIFSAGSNSEEVTIS